MNCSDRHISEAVWVCVDVETTGLNVEEGHRVCEVAAVKGTIEGQVQELSTLVNPQIPIPPDVVAISGLTDAQVADAPLFKEIGPAVHQFLSDAVIVAHNAPFDVGFLEAELHNVGLSVPRAPIIDTMVIARSVFVLQVRNLAAVAEALDLDHRPTHRALADAHTTRDLLLAGVRRLLDEGARTVGDLVEALMPPLPDTLSLRGAVLPAICSALTSGADLYIAYEGSRGETRRTIRPIRLELKRKNLLLSAYCRERQAPRNFRVDRIAAVLAPNSCM